MLPTSEEEGSVREELTEEAYGAMTTRRWAEQSSSEFEEVGPQAGLLTCKT